MLYLARHAEQGDPVAAVRRDLDVEHGLADRQHDRVKGYSLGMRQRLGLATTLLGNPGVLVLDEPANGLDPEGIVWLRGFLRHLAHDEGRTVLVSSHLMSEMALTADRLIVVGRGRLIAEASGRAAPDGTGPQEGTRVVGLLGAGAWSERAARCNRPAGDSAGLTTSTGSTQGSSSVPPPRQRRWSLGKECSSKWRTKRSRMLAIIRMLWRATWFRRPVARSSRI